MIMNTASGMMEFEGQKNIVLVPPKSLFCQNNDLGGPKDTITSLWTKDLKALVPPNSFDPLPMGGVGVYFKDLGSTLFFPGY